MHTSADFQAVQRPRARLPGWRERQDRRRAGGAGQSAGALKSFRDGLAIRDRLAKADPGNAGWQRDPGAPLWHLAQYHIQQNLPIIADHWQADVITRTETAIF
jgi:hypothetical protein